MLCAEAAGAGDTDARSRVASALASEIGADAIEACGLQACANVATPTPQCLTRLLKSDSPLSEVMVYPQ